MPAPPRRGRQQHEKKQGGKEGGGQRKEGVGGTSLLVPREVYLQRRGHMADARKNAGPVRGKGGLTKGPRYL